MKHVEVIVMPNGEVKIEAVGFKGADCDKATRYLEDALGQVDKRKNKIEYSQQSERGQVTQ
jgi:hypothetical protein